MERLRVFNGIGEVNATRPRRSQCCSVPTVRTIENEATILLLYLGNLPLTIMI